MAGNHTARSPEPEKGPSRRVVCWETGETYPSASAAEAMGLKSEASIKTAIRMGYAAGGCHWRFSE